MSRPVSRSTVDLTAARARLSFSPDLVNKLLNEGSRDIDMRQAVTKVISSDPLFAKSKRYAASTVSLRMELTSPSSAHTCRVKRDSPMD